MKNNCAYTLMEDIERWPVASALNTKVVIEIKASRAITKEESDAEPLLIRAQMVCMVK